MTVWLLTAESVALKLKLVLPLFPSAKAKSLIDTVGVDDGVGVGLGLGIGVGVGVGLGVGAGVGVAAACVNVVGQKPASCDTAEPEAGPPAAVWPAVPSITLLPLPLLMPPPLACTDEVIL